MLLTCAIENLRQRHWMDAKEDLNPDDVLKVASQFKGLDMIISNGPSPLFAMRLEEISKQRNGSIFYDYSRVEILNDSFKKFVGLAGADKVVFGTISPMQYEETQYAKLYNSNLSEEDKKAILGGNLQKLFNL